MKDTAQKMQTPELPDLPAQEFGAVCTHALSLIDQNREYLQMHFSGRGDERAETALSDIEVETVRLERALAGMLRLWEVSGGSAPPRAQRFCRLDLCRLLGAVEAMEEPLFRQLGVTLRVEFSGLKQVLLLADPDRVEQVLLHLLSNALQACSGSRNAKVELTLRPEGEGYTLTVADNGCGLPVPERWQENHRRFLGGAKVGLRLCRAYCADAGWEFSLTDRPGGGAAAVIRMPAQAAELPDTVELSAAGEPEQARLLWLLRRELRLLCPPELPENH